MSIESGARRVSIYKHRETGMVALCREVVEFVDQGEPEKYALDTLGAYFEASDAGLWVHFPRIQVKVDQVVGYRPAPGEPEEYGQVLSVSDNAAMVLFVGSPQAKSVRLIDLRPTPVGA